MIHPINGQVYLQEEVEQTSKFGIVLPNAKVSSIGTIYAIEENEFQLQKGDRVIFSKYAIEDVSYSEDGKQVPNLKSLHIDAIHAILR